MANLQSYSGMFMAKAYVIKEQTSELQKYLDAPAFAKGDLYYINNLIAVLDAANNTITPRSPNFDVNRDGSVTFADIQALITQFKNASEVTDVNGDYATNPYDYAALIEQVY